MKPISFGRNAFACGVAASCNLLSRYRSQMHLRGRIHHLVRSSKSVPPAAGPSQPPLPCPPSAPRALASLALSALLIFLGLPGPAAIAAALPSASAAAAGSEGVGQVSSLLEDGVKTALRKVDSALESAVGKAVDTVLTARTDAAKTAEEDKLARQIINEVFEIIDETYTDARNGGFNRDKWKALRDEALSASFLDSSAAHRAAKRMIAEGLSDPYTRFINPTEFTSMLKYDITGVGLNLVTGEEFQRKANRSLPDGRNPSSVFVLGVIKSSVADRAGISEGDEILKIDGRPTGSMSPFQAASAIQGGPEDEDASRAASSPLASTSTAASAPQVSAAWSSGAPKPVTLSFRKPDGSVLETTIDRPDSPVSVSPVSYKLDKSPFGGDKTGWIRLSNFNAQAQRKVKEAVVALEKQGARRLVLDLRDNRGGLVSEGIEVARLFLEDESVVVVTEGRARSSDKPITAPGPALTKLPVVVLVNEHTASASEILAGALKDNCRAVVAGSKTYGKGLIQSVYELGDGSGLVVTVGKYLTPGLVDIDTSGVVPDFRGVPDLKKQEESLGLCRIRRDSGRAGAAAVAAAPPGITPPAFGLSASAAAALGMTGAAAEGWSSNV